MYELLLFRTMSVFAYKSRQLRDTKIVSTIISSQITANIWTTDPPIIQLHCPKHTLIESIRIYQKVRLLYLILLVGREFELFVLQNKPYKKYTMVVNLLLGCCRLGMTVCLCMGYARLRDAGMQNRFLMLFHNTHIHLSYLTPQQQLKIYHYVQY